MKTFISSEALWIYTKNIWKTESWIKAKINSKIINEQLIKKPTNNYYIVIVTFMSFVAYLAYRRINLYRIDAQWSDDESSQKIIRTLS